MSRKERGRQAPKGTTEIQFIEPVDLPRRGFEVLFSSVGKRATFTMIRVPHTTPFEIVYTKPDAGIDFSLIPTGQPNLWTIEGKITTNTIQSLGLQVSRRRMGGEDPLVTRDDVAEMRKLGVATRVGQSHFDVSLTVSADNVRSFLTEAWQPEEVRNDYAGPEIQVPAMSLGEVDQTDFVLPQKFPTSNVSTSGSLVVYDNSSLS